MAKLGTRLSTQANVDGKFKSLDGDRDGEVYTAGTTLMQDDEYHQRMKKSAERQFMLSQAELQNIAPNG